MSADHSKCTPVVIQWGNDRFTDSCSCTVDRYRALFRALEQTG